MPRFDFYPSFNAGEVSPLIDARTSLEKYRSACRTLENFQILPYGGVIRRPGTEFLGPVKSPTASSAVRLIGFNFSTTTRYVLELGNLYMRFWSGATGALINGGGGSPFEVATPYAAADLRELQFVQINDIMYFAHASYPAYKLSRLADNNWTFAAVDWEYPPTVEIDPEIQIKANASKGVVTLTSNTSFFTANDVGTQLALTFGKRVSFAEGAIAANGFSGILPISAGGKWTFQTSGTWSATITIFRKNPETMNDILSTIGAPIVRSGTTATITVPNHGYDAGDTVHLYATEIPVTRSGTTATAKFSAHGFTTGNTITTTGIAPFAVTGASVTRVDDDTFTFPVANSGATRGTILIPAPFAPTAAPFATSYTIQTVPNANTFTITVANSDNARSLVNVSNVTRMETVRVYDADSNRNVVADGEEAYATELLVQVSNYVSNSSARYLLETRDFTEGGRVQISAVASGTSATGTVVSYLGLWAGERLATSARQTAFNARYGYARSVSMHEQRLCFGGTSSYPNTIWASETENFENFQIGTTAASAFQFTLAASEGNRINWLHSQTRLLIGTSGDEWAIGSADTAQSLSATNVEAKRQSSYGSKYMRAQIVNDVLLFIQRSGRKVRELVYELNKDGWVAPDLTLLAEHITAGEIVEIAYQQQPDAILWCVRGDGALLAMTYERDQKVVGWHRHLIADAEVESVATIYGNGTEDELWMVIKRTISGNPYRTVERFPLLWRKRFDDSTTADYRYLDSFETFASGSANRSVTGLAHLNGKTVTIVQGTNVATATVSGNAVNVPQASAGYLGLPFTSTLRPMKLEADFENGTAQSRKKRIHQIVVRTHKSRGGAVRTNNGPFYDLSSTLTTGDQKLVLGGAFGIDADVDLRVTTPDPFCCIAILPKWDAYGNE
jgi:hypothetical protein